MSRPEREPFNAIIRAQGSRFRLSLWMRSALWRMAHSESWIDGWLSIGCVFGAPASMIEHDRAARRKSATGDVQG